MTMFKTKEEIEEWRPVVGFEERYHVSSKGRIKALSYRYVNKGNKNTTITEKIRVPVINKHGYLMIGLSGSNGRVFKQVHRVVATAFIPNPFGKKFVNHLDSNRGNNLIENLEWVTRKENMEHMVKAGRSSSGSLHRSAKLDWAKVLTIRTLSSASKMSMREVAKKYNISHQAISQCVKNKTWRNI